LLLAESNTSTRIFSQTLLISGRTKNRLCLFCKKGTKRTCWDSPTWGCQSHRRITSQSARPAIIQFHLSKIQRSMTLKAWQLTEKIQFIA